jgi:hypothetical protein
MLYYVHWLNNTNLKDGGVQNFYLIYYYAESNLAFFNKSCCLLVMQPARLYCGAGMPNLQGLH